MQVLQEFRVLQKTKSQKYANELISNVQPGFPLSVLRTWLLVPQRREVALQLLKKHEDQKNKQLLLWCISSHFLNQTFKPIPFTVHKALKKAMYILIYK